MNPITINQETCKSCGICSVICPRHIPEVREVSGKKETVVSAERAELCAACGQCVTVCPTDSITIDALDMESFRPVEESHVDPNEFLQLMKNRRSVRRYSNKPVERETIDRIIEAAHISPTGSGKNSLGVIAVSNPDLLKEIGNGAIGAYEDLDKNLANPMIRLLMKMSVGKARINTLTDFVMPGMRWYIKWFKEGKGNEITRDCPLMIFFHSNVSEPSAQDNCWIAASFSMLLARSLGVEGFFNGLIGPVINRSSELRDLIGLPENREVYASLSLGYSKYKYRKTVPRRLAAVTVLD